MAHNLVHMWPNRLPEEDPVVCCVRNECNLRFCLETGTFEKIAAMRSFPFTVFAVHCSLALSSWAQQLECKPCNDNFGKGVAQNRRQLTVSPPALHFGKVTVGSTASQTATLTASNGAVTISSDRSNSPEFSITGLALPVKIRSGKSVQATIQVTPNAPGKADAKAGFFSNAGDSPTIEQLTGTGVAQGPHDVYLTWDPGSPDAVGYNISRGTVHGGPYQQINSVLDASTNYTDYNVAAGDTYYYVATEVNNQGQESGYLKEVKAKIRKN